MNIGKPILAAVMSLATLAPCKAQKSVQYIAETGFTGVVNNGHVLYSGMNFGFPRGKNYTNLYAGMNLNSDKQVSFVGLALNNYNWTKNISSWVREAFSLSKRGANSTLEVAPIRANTQAGKFDISFAPAYVVRNDFKAGTATQGINTIFQTTYSITPSDKIYFEAAYTSTPAKNIFKTHFDKFADNISYMISYMKSL